MLYEISEMYKRDTSFTLCESENAIQFSDVQNCKMISFINRPLDIVSPDERRIAGIDG